MEANGTVWWTHDYNNNYVRSVARLKAPLGQQFRGNHHFRRG